MARIRPAVLWAPYGVVTLIHLVVLGAGADGFAAATKWLLMPALLPVLLAGARSVPRRRVVLLAAGVVASWIGDVTIGTLIVGLSFFLLAHVAYTAMFVATVRGRVAVWSAGYAVWFAVFAAVLWPYLGDLRWPVLGYGLLLGAMAAVATRAGPLAAVGGFCFVASDSVLAFRLFTDLLPGAAAGVVVMVLYLGAQALIVLGALRAPAPERTPA